jgi:CubicO group peptidase (beta-lactamase class C family)
MTDIGGETDPGFENVRAAFEDNFERHQEVGAAVAVYVHGHKVVDLWGGVADETGRPYDDSTLQMVFSTTKGATAACANLLAQRGKLDIDAPVVTYWPEFGQAGKDHIPVRWLLCHKAGLPIVDKQLSLDEVLAWDPVIEALEVQEPMWEPGSAHGYHAVTYGWLVGELVRRVSGRSLGTYFAEEIAEPLGLEFWIGLPPEQLPRVAPIIPLPEPATEEQRAMIEMFVGPETLVGKALAAPSGVFADQSTWNRPDVLMAEIPAANGVGNARSVARMYAGLVGALDHGPPKALLMPSQIESLSTCQTSGNDRVIFFETTVGLGFWTASPFAPYGGRAGFGHAGAGGSVGFADPENGIGFGYVMNRMQLNLTGDPRTRALIAAVYDAIGVEPAFV